MKESFRPGFGIASLCIVSLAGVLSVFAQDEPSTPASQRGSLEIYLEPYDEKTLCSVTIGLRNDSGVRQGFADLEISWYDDRGSELAATRQRMDSLRPGFYDAKNHTLSALCSAVRRAVVRSAEWELFEGSWDVSVIKKASIEGVADTTWEFEWSDENKLFVGTAPKE